MDMIHVRMVSPVDLTEAAVTLLAADPCVLNLVVQPGSARNPDGDALACDVLTGGANDVLRGLRELRLDQLGSIVIEPVDVAFSGRAAEAGAQRLGALTRAPVWEEGRGAHPGGGHVRAEFLPLSGGRRSHRSGRDRHQPASSP